MAGRRSLHFDDLDQVVAEINHLLDGGYTPTGNWNLAQVCGHLNDWMRYSMDGYPAAPLPIRTVLWLVKVSVGRRQFDRILKHGFRDRLPTMPATVPAADARSDSEAVQLLSETVERLKTYTGPVHPSPIYGPLTQHEAVQLQLVHCAHHLSFLQPNQG